MSEITNLDTYDRRDPIGLQCPDCKAGDMELEDIADDGVEIWRCRVCGASVSL